MSSRLSQHSEDSVQPQLSSFVVVTLMALVPALLSPTQPCLSSFAPKGTVSPTPFQTSPNTSADGGESVTQHALQDSISSTWGSCSFAMPEVVAVFPVKISARVSFHPDEISSKHLEYDTLGSGSASALISFGGMTPNSELWSLSNPSQGSSNQLRSVVLRV
jgi:hypothetical protein